MSSDDIEFVSNTEDIMEDNTEDTIKDDDQTTTSQQALKQLSQLTANNSNNCTSKVTAVASTSTNVATANLQKIEPKLTLPGTAKIVYIKNANGTQQSIRIGSSLISGNQAVSANNSNSNANASSQAIQKVQLLQLKNKNVATASVAASTISPRIVLKSGNAQPKFIISSSDPRSNTRTITVSQAQQMGLIVSSNKTTASTSASTSSASTSNKTLILPASTSAAQNITLKNQPTILNKGVKAPLPTSKILIQSESTGDVETKAKTPTTVPSIVKMAGTGQPVRVLQGKQLQYVRVLNAIPPGSTNSTKPSKIVNGRQQQVFVQRKIVPQPGGTTQITTAGKPHQFVTKKLEVMPIASTTTKIIKKEPTTQTVKAPATYLLNNVQKNLITSSIDIKPVATSNQSESFEITETKEEPLSPSSAAPKKFATSRTYSLSTDRKSKSPEPIQANLMYSTLKLPSPEPIEGNYLGNILQFFSS